MNASSSHSLAEVRTALSRVQNQLVQALRIELPDPGQSPRRVVTCGIGGSEGPARILAGQLVAAGLAARFCAVSQFLVAPPAGDLLVVFSQGLSPNGCLPLDAAADFRARWVVTSVDYGPTNPQRARRLQRLRARGVVPIVAPPGEEASMLVRWVGPTVASLIALRLGHLLGARGCDEDILHEAPKRYQLSAAERLPPNVAIVLAGVSVDEAHGHRWKILETLLGPDPPVWDVLSVAHGPLQALYARPASLITLERPGAAMLVERLASALSLSDTRLRRLRASSDDVLAPIEHAGLIDAALLATLEAHPRNLFDWPGRGNDAPLYDLGS